MSSDAASRKRAALVLNPSKPDTAELPALLAAMSSAAGWEPPLVRETTIEDPGQQVTRQALSEGADAVLVAGGDGTVRAVSEAMAGTGVPLAIVPSGTGNLLARNLELPLTDPAVMMKAVFEGGTQPIDIGWAKITDTAGATSEHAFVVLAGIGLDADMIANTRSDLKKSVGWVAYVDGAARSLPRAKPYRIVYELDSGRLHSARMQSMLFANCGTLPAGISLIPDGSITDGTLDIAIIQPRGALGWLAVWRTVWWQNSVLRRTRAGRRMIEIWGTDRAVRFLSGTTAEAASVEPIPVELDGDEFGQATRIRCRIHPSALVMVVPDGHDVSRL